MSDFAAFLCSQSQAHGGILTEAQVTRYFTRGKITADELACILNPECPCQWPTAAAEAPA